tara:strand:+ start:324 stop:437 length:114 start_codon:yes stop_codon:yes gene_type:complete
MLYDVSELFTSDMEGLSGNHWMSSLGKDVSNYDGHVY